MCFLFLQTPAMVHGVVFAFMQKTLYNHPPKPAQTNDKRISNVCVVRCENKPAINQKKRLKSPLLYKKGKNTLESSLHPLISPLKGLSEGFLQATGLQFYHLFVSIHAPRGDFV